MPTQPSSFQGQAIHHMRTHGHPVARTKPRGTKYPQPSHSSGLVPSLSLSLYLSKCFLYKRQHIVFYWREARKPSHIPKSTNHKSHVKNSSSFSKTTLSHSHEIYHWYKLHHEIDHEMISSPPFSFSPKTGDRFESTSLPFASAPTWRPFR